MSRLRQAYLAAGLLFSMAGPVTAQTEWRVSAEPTLVIGLLDAPPDQVFDDVRGAVLIEGGRVAVADGGSREIRTFGPDGRTRTTFGRRGQGPREFGAIGWLDTCGGSSLFVYDFLRHRITKWSPDGDFVDGFEVDGPNPDTPPYAVSCGPDGTFAVLGWPALRAVPAGTGPYRLPMDVSVTDSLGQRVRVVGTFPGVDRYRYRANDGPRFLGRSTTVRMGVRGVYVGTADQYRIEVVAPDGSRSTFGDGGPGEPVTAEIRERWTSDYLRDVAPDRQPEIRRTLSMPDLLPNSLPAYAGFQLDRRGFVWVKPMVVPSASRNEGAQWKIFDPDGREVALVLLPPGFEPTDIGADYLLGVARDELGVERVYRYALERNER